AGEYPEAFELELHGFSCFPDPKRPKTLCVETSNHTAATGLYLRIGKILVENGFDVDERPWVPHITLGRVRMQSETCPTDGITIPEIKFEVTSFELMESELTGDGPVYTVLDSIAL
ncbi:MAG: RNA 2',3'-cyclic phosphodiesterase, partial [Candidatus Uhrbacteria bacterium]